MPDHQTFFSGRSVSDCRQSAVNPNAGASALSANQKSVNAEISGAQYQCAVPFASTAHHRAPLGACSQSTASCGMIGSDFDGLIMIRHLPTFAVDNPAENPMKGQRQAGVARIYMALNEDRS